MKKVLYAMLALALSFNMAACREQEQAQPTMKPVQNSEIIEEITVEPEISPENTVIGNPYKPSDLLDEKFNLFSDVDFPQNYTVYGACIELDEYNLYRLYMTAEGSPEDIITYMSKSLGDGAQESIQQNIDAFNTDGSCNIFGTQIEEGLNVDCKISSAVKDDSDYEYVDGCTINLVMGIEKDDISDYRKLIEDNYNLGSLNVVNNYFGVSPLPDRVEMKINTYANNVQTFTRYQMDNIDDIKENMFANIKYDYSEENRICFRYGDLNIDIHFDSQKGIIYLSQFLNSIQTSLKDYVPKNTLENLGFKIYVEEEASCTYLEEDNNIYFGLNRLEWGEPENIQDKDAITFITNITDYILVVRYYPSKETYAIQADKGDISAKYTYDEVKEEYSGEWTNAEVSVKEIFEDVFQKPDTDSILKDAVAVFCKSIEDTFSMSPKELFELPYE